MSACHSISGTVFRDTIPTAPTWAGFKGKKNGELLGAAESAGYSVLITVDQGIPRQQNLATRRLSIILIRSQTNQIEDLLPVVDEILNGLMTIAPGQVVVVG